MSERLVEVLLRRSVQHPDRVAIVTGDSAVTWGELGWRVRNAATALMSLGVRQRDHVIVAATASPSFVAGYFATHWLGATALPVDPRTPTEKLAYIASEVNPRGVFLSRHQEIPGTEVRSIEDLWLDETEGPAPDEPVSSDPEDPADILFTSGTTGRPKGVVLSHRAIQAAAHNINDFIGNGPDDREVTSLPLSHSFGLGRLRCQVLAGGTLIVAEGLTATGLLFDLMSQWDATGFTFVPAGLAVVFQISGDRLGEYADSLRWVEIGSAVLPADHKDRLMRLLPRTRLCMHYGLTEASRSTFIEFHQAKKVLSSIGRETPNVEIRVVDSEGQDCPAEQRGRLVVRGRHLMTGYWNDPDGTRDSFVEDWLITGDVGYRDKYGYLYMEAREKDLINVGGREVSPVELEMILEEHPAVKECACAGIPDPRGITGMAVKAYFVAEPSIEELPAPGELVKLLRGRVEPYKMPIAFEWIDSIPRTTSGKIQRGLLGDDSAAVGP